MEHAAYLSIDIYKYVFLQILLIYNLNIIYKFMSTIFKITFLKI